ncbi:hypothetical protein TWF106_010585 [Orbilia oligospora]|uniref:BTB domain-containing protein n=1 Tax=Orbilia oligospora TaxID=2813651 RepID=A0A7C8QXY1_ORBOL|nr:hypothetical protein TWF106_010585 [Orbilia oligospora]
MTKRGIPGCPSYCKSCKLDCTCDQCGYCHSCQTSTAYSTGGTNHRWCHNCTGLGPTGVQTDHDRSVGKFLRETSDRFAQYCVSEVYTIKIGEDKKYFIHSEALRQTSPVMKKHIELEMKEKTSKTIELKDIVDNDVAFTLFIQFSYFGTYGYDDSEKEDALHVHAMVYVFAEKFEVLELKSLALKKATSLCSKAITNTSATSLIKVLQFILPETIPIIYNSTYDPNTGKYPSTITESADKDAISISTTSRDGFRMLLAKFAAHNIDSLRRNESFMSVLQDQPAFSADVLLFTGASTGFKTDGKGCLEF